MSSGEITKNKIKTHWFGQPEQVGLELREKQQMQGQDKGGRETLKRQWPFSPWQYKLIFI